MFARLLSVFRDELGASIIEYAVVGSLIAVICLFGIGMLGTNVGGQLMSSGTAIGTAATSSAQ